MIPGWFVQAAIIGLMGCSYYQARDMELMD